MVYIGEKKYACATCIKGHRSSSCQHTDRPLFAIRAKGRPVSQCEHCRELRKTKQVHVKCECDTKPGTSSSGAAPPNGDLAGAQLIVARKGARKVKTLEPAHATFPNGIPADMVEAATIISGISDSKPGNDKLQCTCNNGGTCECCTDRYIPKKAQAEGSRGHSSRPSISLTIPALSDGSASPSGSASVTPITQTFSRSHSRSPSRSHHPEGHQIGGSQNGHHAKHIPHYSPYALDHMQHHQHEGLRSPVSPGTGNQALSPALGATLSPSTAPTSASPQLLAPPGDMPFSYSPHDLPLPPSPLSVDMDRPNSALSMNGNFATGSTTPTDFALMGGSNVPMSTNTDWNVVGMELGSSSSFGDSSQMGNLLSPDQNQLLGVSGQGQQQPFTPQHMRYRQQDLSPISPSTPQFYSPPVPPSPTSYASQNNSFDMPAFNIQNATALGFADSSKVNEQMQNMSVSNSFHLSPYPSVFDDEGSSQEQGDPGPFGPRSRRGSHQSVASSIGGSLNAPEIRFMSASPVPPQSAASNASAAELSASMSLLNTDGRNCGAHGQACHCWSLNGNEQQRCGQANCPCCSSYGLPGETDLDTLLRTSTYAVSTERDAGYNLGSGVQSTPTLVVDQNNQGTNGFSLHVPEQMTRSRSSSTSSHVSAGSVHSQMGDGGLAANAVGATNLGRANSTGQIGRSSRYKNILPKPTASAPTLGPGAVSAQQRLKPNSLPGSNVPSGASTPLSSYDPQPGLELPFTFPRPASANDLRSSEERTSMMNDTMDANDISKLLAGIGSGGQSFPKAPTIVFGADGGESRGYTDAGVLFGSMPSTNNLMNLGAQSNQNLLGSTGNTNFNTQGGSTTPSHQGHNRAHSFANSMSASTFLQEPKPLHFSHGRSSSTSLLDMGRDIEFIVTPASPFNPPQ